MSDANPVLYSTEECTFAKILEKLQYVDINWFHRISFNTRRTEKKLRKYISLLNFINYDANQYLV
jgi:hypothetical protein